MRPILYLLAAIVLSACTADTEASFDRQILKALDKSLLRDAGVAIQIPRDGHFRDAVYQGSGEKTAAAFQTAFDRYAASTRLVEGCRGTACIEGAGRDGAGYFVALQIVHWEERQTAWSGKRDRLTIKVAVFDVADRTELASAFLQGNSTWATLGGDHVDDLLPSMVPQYVASLY